jgi:catechol 2,3-dioxygenase-like lactoylglutathione lyase family enzyme
MRYHNNHGDEALGKATGGLCMTTIQQISAITLAVQDMARAVAFYQRLGFEVLYGNEQATFTSFRLGDTFLNLISTPSYSGQWWGRVIFRVTEVDALHTALTAKGMTLESPRDGPWGERYFHLQDPDGHELSFAQLLA